MKEGKRLISNPKTRKKQRDSISEENPIREWLPSIGLGRASSPGYKSKPKNLQSSVCNWIKSIKSLGFRSIISLLSEEELKDYDQLPNGLLGQYKLYGFEVASIPVSPDNTPVLNPLDQCVVINAFQTLPKPIIIHCHAGIVRSGIAVQTVLSFISKNGIELSKDQHREILRLIHNSHQDYSEYCTMARGRYGLSDYAYLSYMLSQVNINYLNTYLNEIDVVRRSWNSCPHCSLKFLAFCRIYSAGRLPVRNKAYQDEYDRIFQNLKVSRDFMSEVREAIHLASIQPSSPITKVRYYHASDNEDS